MSKSVGLLIRNSDGKYLLQFRDNAPANTRKLCWGAFGGHLDPVDGSDSGELEDPIICAQRELREELGIVATTHQLTLIGSFEKEEPEDGNTYYCVAYSEVVDWRMLDIREGAGGAFFTSYEVSILQPITPRAREMFRRFAE